MITLLDLLKHQIADLYSAEDQIIEALPLMIDKVTNTGLASALSEHLKVTIEQKTRLEQVQKALNDSDEAGFTLGENKSGFLSRLFGGGAEKCKAMEGLITEGNSLMGEEMSEEVLDAAIIGAAKKIEHYEIAGYGTARAYATELKLTIVADLLSQTLREEYTADDILTKLAVGDVNLEAERSDGTMSRTNKDAVLKKGPSVKKQDSKVPKQGNKGLRAVNRKDSKGNTKSSSKTSFVKAQSNNNAKSSAKSGMPSKSSSVNKNAKPEVNRGKKAGSGSGKISKGSSAKPKVSSAKSAPGKNNKPAAKKIARPVVKKSGPGSNRNSGKKNSKGRRG